MTDLIKVEASEYGLEENKAKQISVMFKPMLDKMVELEDDYNDVMALEISENSCEIAGNLLKEYVGIRTGTAKIHKELKAFYLQGGRFVDGWKNAQLMASQDHEKNLKARKDHFANLEKERINQIGETRKSELEKYTESIPDNLGEMEESTWNLYLSGAKSIFLQLQEAEKQAELQKELDKLENDRIRLENEELKKQADSERAEKEYIELELKAKQDAEIEAELLAEKERQEAIEAELSKGDIDKVKDLIEDLLHITRKYDFESETYKKMFTNVRALITKIITFIEV